MLCKIAVLKGPTCRKKKKTRQKQPEINRDGQEWREEAKNNRGLRWKAHNRQWKFLSGTTRRRTQSIVLRLRQAKLGPFLFDWRKLMSTMSNVHPKSVNVTGKTFPSINPLFAVDGSGDGLLWLEEQRSDRFHAQIVTLEEKKRKRASWIDTLFISRSFPITMENPRKILQMNKT